MNYTVLVHTAYNLITLGLVFSLMKLIGGHLFHSLMSNPGEREELVKKYGTWAVRTAEAVCPLGDWECVEREAKRLLEARLRR